MERYNNKKTENENNELLINKIVKDIEQIVATEMRMAVLSLEIFVRNMPLLISPVVDVVYTLPDTMVDVNLRRVLTSDCGGRQSSMCVNASTSISYIESNCNYILISIPLQKLKRSKKFKIDSMFIFQLNADNSISLPLFMIKL